MRYDSTVALYEKAAGELNAYANEVCGVSFPVNEERTHTIFIGKNGENKDYIDSLDNAPLKKDGYRIAFKNGDIYIYGNTAVGTYFGVCAFIERFLGVRWLNIDTTHIPKKDYMEIEEKEIVEAPIFPQRVFYTSHALALNPENSSQDSAAIAAHQKFKFPATHLERYLGIPQSWNASMPSPHNALYYVSRAKYEEAHPEFFIKSPMGTHELCYSNGIADDYTLDEGMEESVVKIAAQTLYELIKKQPEIEFYSFGKEDDRTAICHCPTCERRRQELGGESGVMMVFFNALIAQTEKLLRADGITSDFKIVTLAYQNTEEPPVKEGKPYHAAVVPSNRLHIRYAPISADYTYSLTDMRQIPAVRTQLLGWAILTSNIMIWDYQNNYTEYCWYFPNLCYFKENLQDYAKIGVSYLFNQAAYNINRHWQDEMRSYIASKLYWDLSLDVTALRNEYIELLYGVAAEEVKTFIDKMEDFFAEKVKKGFRVELFVDRMDFFDPKEYPIDFLLDCLALIERGMEKVKGAGYPDEEKRMKDLSRVLLTPLRMIAKNESYYFPEGNTNYEKRVFSAAKFVGLQKLGEGVPLFVEIAKKGASAYKIVLGQTPTEAEKEAAECLQAAFCKASGLTLPIVKDDKVYPAYNERAFCVGGGMMFREFYKGSLQMEDYEYFVDVKGRCAFVLGNDLKKGVDVFIEQLLVEDGEIVLPAVKKEKKAQ